MKSLSKILLLSGIQANNAVTNEGSFVDEFA
jgi:hypothetical protein